MLNYVDDQRYMLIVKNTAFAILELVKIIRYNSCLLKLILFYSKFVKKANLAI